MYYKLLSLFIFITTSFAQNLITPIPETKDYNQKKALLGKKLFFETKLSLDNTISCASCHILDDGGDDNLRVSFGIKGQQGTRNAPTIFNVRYNTLQFWDGRATTLQEQIKGPIHNPVEMGSNFKYIISQLQNDSSYQIEFSKIYQKGITTDTIIDAIVEFQKALTTPNSRFDKYLKGDKHILSKEEIAGYKLFKEYGCISCHNGINIGGNLMQKIGVMQEYTSADFGLYGITKKMEDKFYFKVPSLRNVALTSPYFHDGKINTLDEAVSIMITYQLGYPIDKKEKDNIVKFLKTLTGEVPHIMKSAQ